MVHTTVIERQGAGLRGHRREASRRVFLDAAMEIVERDGLEALTIKSLATQLDCSVGALYRHFRSKGALVAAMQAEAIAVLAEAHDRAVPALDETFRRAGGEVAALGHLLAFGSMVAAARHLYPSAFGLQQQLLSAAPLGMDPADRSEVVPVAAAMMRRPSERVEDAQRAGWLRPGDAFDRVVTWVAALGGVLQLDRVRDGDVVLFEVDDLVHGLTADLLRGWGADPDALDRAAALATPSTAHAALATTIDPERGHHR